MNKDYAKELLYNPAFLLTDDFHIYGVTKLSNVKTEFLEENYGDISFSFDLLERIKKIVQGLHFEDNIRDIDIRFKAPKKDMPLVIIARLPEKYSRNAHDDHPNDTVIILAPRRDKGSEVYPKISNEAINI